MMHQYAAYGLTIASFLPIPELTPLDVADAVPDVWVDCGEVPTEFQNPVTQSSGYQAGPEGLLLRINGVGRYLVRDGNRIVVAPDPEAREHDVRVFLLGTCFGALLHQRGALVLHASGIGTPAGAVLLAGHSGAGKSTLLAEFLRRGHKMMVDDVCAVFPTADGDGLFVQPSYPRTRMWADAAEQLAVDTTGLQRTRSHMDKYERQLPAQFWDQPATVRRIYHLAGAQGDEFLLRRVPQMVVLPLVVAHTYRQVFLDGFDMRRQHFDLASQIARTVPVVQIVRPADGFRITELADLILNDLAAG
jgi:hypothetical protein